MTERTRILSRLVEAARHLDSMQDAVTHAYVMLEERQGFEPRAVEAAVNDLRHTVYDERLAAQLEHAITLAGRMP